MCAQNTCALVHKHAHVYVFITVVSSKAASTLNLQFRVNPFVKWRLES